MCAFKQIFEKKKQNKYEKSNAIKKCIPYNFILDLTNLTLSKN